MKRLFLVVSLVLSLSFDLCFSNEAGHPSAESDKGTNTNVSKETNENETSDETEKILLDILYKETGIDYTLKKTPPLSGLKIPLFTIRPEDFIGKEKNNPDWKIESKFDEKSGIVTISVIPTSEKFVTIDITSNFTSNYGLGYNGFEVVLSDKNETNKIDEDLNSLLKSLNANNKTSVYMAHSSHNELLEPRLVVLKKGEKFLKEMYVWDIENWDELCKAVKANHNLKLELKKSIIAEIEDYVTIHVVIVPINYNIVNKMIQVKKKYDLEQKIKTEEEEDSSTER
jgi:hypothetical protein